MAFGLLTLATLLAPLNYVLLQAGPTDNLLGENVKIRNIKSNEFKSGALYSTSVFVTSPNLKPLGIEVLLAWLDGDRAVLPRDAIYEKNKSAQAERAFAMWPNKGDADSRPAQNALYQKVLPITPIAPAVPRGAIGELRIVEVK